IILGLTLIPVAVLVRPRPGRAPRSRARLRREQAPSLFALVERVADRVGTAAPDMIVLDHRFEAGIVRLGWRRRAVLRLGAPLWLCLDPGMRVALLAHELAHDVNADPERGRFVEPALNTIRRLAVGSEADRSIDEILNGNKRRRPSMVADIARMGLWLANRVFLLVHLAVVRVGAGDHQRAEYFADWVSAKVAGTAATQRLLDQLLLGRGIVSTVEHNAHRIGPQRWRQLAAELEAGAREQLQLLRQFSRRSTSMWDRHPPHGLRAELVGFWPNQPAGLVLTQAASDHIDRDLAFWFTGYHRRILGTRMFQESAEGLASG
ncbi:MAG: M48 family metallopeptidase, partial [Jatrophihabitantaceae bacterium]